MKKSENEKVQKFLDDAKMVDAEKYNIVQNLRQVVFKCHPALHERMMYGGIMLSLDEDIGGLFVYQKHVSFEFSNGYKMDDPLELLEGKGKFRRHLKFSSVDEIAEKNVGFFVNQLGK